MSGGEGESGEGYDGALRAFVGEREQIARSEARVWHTNAAVGLAILVIFLALVTLGEEPISNVANGLLPLSIGSQLIGFSIFVWFVSALALGFIAYGHSRGLYYSGLADSMASEFRPDADQLVERNYLAGGPSGHILTDLRRQLHESYEHILTRTFLEEEYKDYHESESTGDEGKGHRGRRLGGFLRSFAVFLFGGRWISLDPRRDDAPPYKYSFRALFWPHAFLRSFCLGLYWGSLGGWCVAWATDLHGLVDILLLLTIAFFALYFLQFALFWGRIDKLSERSPTGVPEVVPFTCPNCQAELTVGQDCRVCGQPIDWSSMAPE